MKKYLSFLFFAMVLLSLTACSSQKQSSVSLSTEHASKSNNKMSISNISYKPVAPMKVSAVCLQPDYVTDILMPCITYVNNASPQSQNKVNNRQICVQGKDNNIIIFELNDSPAANDLYNQLPLYIRVEDYSTNEN